MEKKALLVLAKIQLFNFCLVKFPLTNKTLYMAWHNCTLIIDKAEKFRGILTSVKWLYFIIDIHNKF